MKRKSSVVALGAALSSTLTFAAPPMMSPEWIAGLCEAWNREPVLTERLVETEWIRNDHKRGYKLMQIHRADCTGSAPVEMRIAEKDGKALCVASGRAASTLDTNVDYRMWADTSRWVEMGRGDYGPFRAMMFGRLQFEGPKGEAMGNMGPFGTFLQLVGKVAADAACPSD